MSRDLVDVLREFVALFEEQRLEYAVMGGMAVRFLGIPRPTYDLDFTVAVSRDDLERLYVAAEAFGVQIATSYRTGWVDSVAGMPIVKLNFDGVDVDVFLAECAFQKSLLSRRKFQKVDGFCVWIVTAEDLILLKLIANRDRDRADVQDVLFMQGDLDRGYLILWAAQLGVGQLLSEALQKFDTFRA